MRINNFCCIIKLVFRLTKRLVVHLAFLNYCAKILLGFLDFPTFVSAFLFSHLKRPLTMAFLLTLDLFRAVRYTTDTKLETEH